MRSVLKRLLQLVPVALAVAMLMGNATPARAEVSCFRDLNACYVRAAFADTYWAMWLMGMDCELGFTDCTRRALIGR